MYLFVIPNFSKKNYLLLIVNRLEAILAFIGNLRYIVANEKKSKIFVLQIVLKNIFLFINADVGVIKPPPPPPPPPQKKKKKKKKL